MSAPEHHSGMRHSTILAARYNVTLSGFGGRCLMHNWGIEAGTPYAALSEAARSWKREFGPQERYTLHDLHNVTGEKQSCQ